MTTPKLIREFGTIFSSEVLLVAASFLSFPILARLLSKADYGLMSLVTMSLMLVANLASGGLNNSVLRFYGKYAQREERLRFVNSQRLATLVLALAAAALYLAAGRLVGAEETQRLLPSIVLLSCLLVPVRALTKIELSFLRISDHVLLMNFFNLMVRYGGIGASLCVLVWYRSDLTGLYLGTLAAEAVVLVAVYALVAARLPDLAFRAAWDRQQVREAFHYGLPLALSGLLSYVLSGTDRYVIGYFLSAEQVADYTVALNFCNYPVELLRNVYLATFVPLIMNSWNRSERADTAQLTNYMASYFWLAVPIVFGLSLTDAEGIRVLAGSRYTAVPGLTPLLATSCALNGMNFLFIAGLLYRSRTRVVLYLNVMAGVLNLLVNLLLVPRLGIYGAGVSSLVSYLTFIVVATRLSRRELSYAFPVRDIAASLAAGLLMTLALRLIFAEAAGNLLLFVKIVVGLLVYLLFVFLFAKSRFLTLVSAFRPLGAKA